jgi:hypothetical protein
VTTSDYWGTDTPISMPEPPTDRPVVVDMGGFGFTTGGITHNLTEEDREETFSPFFSPEGYREGDGG